MTTDGVERSELPMTYGVYVEKLVMVVDAERKLAAMNESSVPCRVTMHFS